MKNIKLIAIAGLCLSMVLAGTTSCKKKGGKSAHVPQALVDSASYLAGVHTGVMLRNYNFCEKLNNLNVKLYKEGIEAAVCVKGDFGTEEFKTAFSIDPETMNTVFPAYLEARADSAYVVNKAQLDSVSYLLGVNSGLMIRFNFGIAESMEDLNLDEVREGTDAILGLSKEVWEGGDEEAVLKAFKISPRETQRIFMELALAKTKAASAEFLEDIACKKGIVKTESGLLYEIIEPGNEVKPAPEDEVSVYYEGTLIDGTKFDGNMEADQPISFALNGVIKGWTEGLQYIGEGGHIKLYIPSDLGYGDRGAGYQIKGGAALVFEVKLVSVKKAEPAAEEAEEAIAEENAAVLAE